MMAVFATGCLEGTDAIDAEVDAEVDGAIDAELDADGFDEVDGASLQAGEAELPATPDPKAKSSPQSLNRNDDPDEGGQIKPKANNVARTPATR